MATFDLGRVTPLYKGDYSASASYELNDVVLYNGNLYWHVQSTTTVGILPTDTTVWKLSFADEGIRAEIRGYADNAQTSANSASASKTAAAQSASQASASASQAALSAQTAQTAETGATASAQTATEKASQAAESAAQAQESVTDAQSEADRAKTYADRAEEVELEIPTNVSQLENDAGYLTEHQSLDDYVRKDILYNMLPTDTASGTVVSFSDGADDIPLKSLVVDIEPVQDLHGYDSPWPAGGGKNMLNVEDSYTVMSQTTLANNITLTSGTYTLSINGKLNNTDVSASIRLHDGTQNIVTIPITTETDTRYTKTFTINAEKTIKVVVSSSTAGYNATVSKIMLEAGSTATDYAPYSNICPISGWTGMTVNANGTEIPISWESEAGTIYGGTLDVTNGVLTVTKGFIQSYNGETLPSTWISDRDAYAQGATPTTGAEVCYDLATPVTYQLTPTEVKSLLGQNNIFADTGDTTVEYRADTSAYVAKKIAEAISALS